MVDISLEPIIRVDILGKWGILRLMGFPGGGEFGVSCAEIYLWLLGRNGKVQMIISPSSFDEQQLNIAVTSFSSSLK